MTEHLQRHHSFWPRKKYKTRLQKAFRTLPCNIQHLNADDHKAVHLRYPNGNPGGMPTNSEMHTAIRKHAEGECICPQKLF